MEKFFEITIRFLSKFFHTKYVAFFQLSRSKDELILKYASGFHPESHQNLKRIRPNIGIFHSLTEKRTFQIENDIFKKEKKLASLVRLDGLESVISVPIFSKGDIWGILALFSQERYKFKKQDGEVLNLWVAQIGELQDFFSSYLQNKLDGNLVQILGNIELLKFRLINKKSIQSSDVINAFDHLKNAILGRSQDLDRFYEEQAFEEKSEERPAEEIYTEEMITIEGEKIPEVEKRKVLIIDDQPIITDLLVDILKRSGYNSEVALCAKDGLEVFAKDGFDLVITDLGMPDISGWEVSRSVKEQNPSVPVILITGWGVEPDPRKMKDSEVDFLISKPFQIDQLEKIIKQLITLKKDGCAT
ncbi:MAG: response regulator [candidate division Zixibacteria bacterium]|nr:response regulator [candidate division Zixibacteria bacterium]